VIYNLISYKKYEEIKKNRTNGPNDIVWANFPVPAVLLGYPVAAII
jgi:hypothetical protein